MEPTTNGIMTPIIQYGFAGFSAVLLGILVWMFKNLLQVLKENNNVIANNTQAIIAVDNNAKEARDVVIEMKQEMIRRPCGENLR